MEQACLRTVWMLAGCSCCILLLQTPKGEAGGQVEWADEANMSVSGLHSGGKIAAGKYCTTPLSWQSGVEGMKKAVVDWRWWTGVMIADRCAWRGRATPTPLGMNSAADRQGRRRYGLSWAGRGTLQRLSSSSGSPIYYDWQPFTHNYIHIP